MPIFIDEAIFLYMARFIREHPWSPFVALSHGHQPFHTWLLVVASFLIPDPLTAGRIVSVFSGFGTLMGLWLASRFYSLNFGKWFVTLAFVFSPLFLLHDRLAIKDSFLACVAIWLFYFTLRWFQSLSWRWMLFASATLGVGLLTKSIASFFVFLVPLCLWSVDLKSVDWKRLFRQGIFFYVIAFGMHSILRLSSGYHNIDTHNASHILTVSEFFKNPFQLFGINATHVVSWLNIYLGWPMILGFLLTLFVFWKRRGKIFLVLAAWVFIPIVVEVFIGRNLSPRYFLFTFLFVYLLGAVLLEEMLIWAHQKRSGVVGLGVGILALLFLWLPFSLSAKIFFNLEQAPLAAIDRWQFLEGWPAGYGLKEAAEFFRKQSKPCVVLTEQNYLTSLGFPLYLKGSACRVEPILTDEAIANLEEIQSRFSGPGVFLVFNFRQNIVEKQLLQEVASYPKVGQKEYLRIFRFTKK